MEREWLSFSCSLSLHFLILSPFPTSKFVTFWLVSNFRIRNFCQKHHKNLNIRAMRKWIWVKLVEAPQAVPACPSTYPCKGISQTVRFSMCWGVSYLHNKVLIKQIQSKLSRNGFISRDSLFGGCGFRPNIWIVASLFPLRGAVCINSRLLKRKLVVI